MAATQFVSEELFRKVAQRREGVDRDVWSLDIIRRAFSWIRKNVRKEKLGQLFSADLRSTVTDSLCSHFERSGSDEEELPNSCRASDVAVFALHVLNRLYQPLIPQDVAEKLWVAASTAVIKPQSVRSTEHMGSKGGGTLEAAQFIARIAVCELQPAGAGGKSRRGDLYTLFKGIIKTLQEIANSDQARHLTPAALGAFVGPALSKVQRAAATANNGQDMSVAVTFLILNYGPVFSELASSNQGSFAGRPQSASARHASAGNRMVQKRIEKRGSLPRNPNGPRVNLLKSLQSPGTSRPHGTSGSRRHSVQHQNSYASGMLCRDGPAEV